MISTNDYLWFVNRTLDQMVAILRQTRRRDRGETARTTEHQFGVWDANHCLGVMRSWGGYLVAGRTIVRDREAEFAATGSVDALIGEIFVARAQLADDVATAQFDAPLRNSPNPADAVLPFGQTQGAALLHLYEELSQHLGQMEISRDFLVSLR